MAGAEQTTDRQWIKQSFEAYGEQLLRYAIKVSGSADQAKEAVQDTFLKLCSQDPAKLGDKVRAWLFAVCRNRVLDLKKKEKPMLHIVDESFEDPAAGDVASGIETKLAARQLFRLMEQLKDNQREVLLLKYQGGLSYKEIAEVTKLTVSNVGFLMHTGLKSLQAAYRKQSKSQGGAR